MRIGPPILRIRDIDTTLEFYENRLGLHAKKRYQEHDKDQQKDDGCNNLFYELSFRHKQSSSSSSYEPLIILKHDPGARIPSPRSAGLFHFAILVPDRKSLASTYIALRNSGVEYDGFADHLVSESLYLRDPENNGIEIYRDRPSIEWPRDDKGHIIMDTLPLDLNSLLSEMTDNNDDNEEKDNAEAFPAGARIGHMHLKVTNLERSIKFYHEKIGLDITVDWSSMGATFFSAGGIYHHHIAINTWHSLNGESHINGKDVGLEGFTLIIPDNSFINTLAQRIFGSSFSYTPTTSYGQLIILDPDGIQFMIRSE